MKVFFLILIPYLVVACAGYKVKNSANPFVAYEIKEVAVPMFLNRSNIANAAGVFTSEIIQTLSQFSDLKVIPGKGKNKQAILLGIVSSAKSTVGKDGTTKAQSFRLSNEVAADATNGRVGFFVPLSTQVQAQLNLILIKNPTQEEIDLLTSDLGKEIKKSPKIIFNETIAVSDSFVREIHDISSTSDAGEVNFTQNQGNFERAVGNMAKNAAQNFKELILYAF